MTVPIMPAASSVLTANHDTSRSAAAMAGLLLASGVTHLIAPGIYTDIVPAVLPGSAMGWTLASGAAELGVGGLLLVPHTRRLGAALAVVLFVVVYPANLKMAIDWRHRSALDQFIGWGRLPLQIPLIWWALRIRRSARSGRLVTAIVANGDIEHRR